MAFHITEIYALIIPMKPRISINILTWNNLNDTTECVNSVLKITYPHLNICLIHNGSSADITEALHLKFPDITHINLPKNLGFAQGHNVGLKRILENNMDYVLLLSHDTTVSEDIIDKFLQSTQAFPQPHIFGAKLYYYQQPKKIWHGLPQWDNHKCSFQYIHHNKFDNTNSLTKTEKMSYACATGMFLPTSIIKDVGFFDPDYFCYFEDIDLCWRASKKNYDCYYIPQAHIWHKAFQSAYKEKTSDTVRYFQLRNKLLWARKQLPFTKRMTLYKNVLWGLFKQIYSNKKSSTHKKGIIKIKLRAIKDFLLCHYGNF